jgi:hypothetical protein
MRIRHGLRLAAAACGSAALVAGCGGGGGKTIDHTTLEKAIEVSVAQQRHQIVIVACPTDVESKKGKRFTCTATTAQGKQYPFRVTAKDDKGHVKYVGLRAKGS